jgi:DNA-3-methyladenine glycosylase II
MALLLQPTSPYSFGLSMRRLASMPRQVFFQLEGITTLVRAFPTGLVRVSSDPSSDPLSPAPLTVQIEGALEPDEVLSLVRHAFSLDLDHQGFLAHMESADPAMAAETRRLLGARPIVPFTRWESLSWAVIGQQISLHAAFSIQAALMRLAGGEWGGVPYFPGPEAVARLTYDQLHQVGFSQRKAEYLIDLARLVVSGELDLASVATLPLEVGIERLVALRGIGRWTAERFLMDAGHLDAFPAADVGVRNGQMRLYGWQEKPSEEQVRAAGERWRPYRALGTYYLWLSLLISKEP